MDDDDAAYYVSATESRVSFWRRGGGDSLHFERIAEVLHPSPPLCIALHRYSDAEGEIQLVTGMDVAGSAICISLEAAASCYIYI